MRQYEPDILIVAEQIGVLFIFFLPERLDVFEGELEVNFVWDEMIREAKDLIEIIAGDLSWLDDNRRLPLTLAAHRSLGVTIKLICKNPNYDKPDLRRRIAFLLSHGIEVRVLPSVYRPVYSGFIIDRSPSDRCTAFRHSTKANLGPHGLKEEKQGRRYVHNRDIDEMNMWESVVTSYWELSKPVALFEKLTPIDETNNFIMEALHKVKQYSLLQPSEIEIGHIVDIESLWGWCLIEDKMERIAPAMDQMSDQGIEPFELCICWSNIDHTIWLPPIVEVHDGSKTVMEGAHRLAYLYKKNVKAQARVILIHNREDLPGEPVPFPKMSVVKSRLGSQSRGKIIDKYEERYWRSFTPMLEFLGGESEKRLLEHRQWRSKNVASDTPNA